MKDESKVAIVLLSGIGWAIVCLGVLWASITLVPGHIFGDIVFSLVVGVIFGLLIARKLIHHLSRFAEPQSYSTYEIDTGEYATDPDDYEYIKPSRATERIARKNASMVKRRQTMPKEILPEDLDKLLWDDRHHFTYVKEIFKQMFSPRQQRLLRATVSFWTIVCIAGILAGALTRNSIFGAFVAVVVMLVFVMLILHALQCCRFIVTEQKIGSFAKAFGITEVSSYILTRTLWEASEVRTVLDKLLGRGLLKIRTREQNEVISEWPYARRSSALRALLDSLSNPTTPADLS